MYNQTESITIRLDRDLYKWLKQTAAIKKCKISDLVRESIIKIREYEDVPSDMQFSKLLEVHGAKAAVMTYRLLEKFIKSTAEQGEEMVVAAGKQGLQEIAKWKAGSD